MRSSAVLKKWVWLWCVTDVVTKFLNTLPTDKKWWVLDRKPETCMQAGELADDYEQARRPETETLASSTPKPNRVGSCECQYCGKSGHPMPRKNAIRGKEKKVNKAEVLRVTAVKSKDTCRGNAQKKVYGVQGTDGQETCRWQTNVQDGQGGGTKGHRHSS